MKKGHLVKASLINGQSKNQGSLFYVVASAIKESPSQEILAGFKCNSCKATFASAKDFEPHCVVCASEDVELDDTLDTPVENVEDTETASIQCTKCNSFNMVSLAGAVAFDNHINCAACANALSYELPESVVAEIKEDSEAFPEAEESESDMEAEEAATEDTESEEEEENEGDEETAATEDDEDFDLDEILDDTDDDEIDDSMEEESEEVEDTDEETAATEESETESEMEEEEETAGADEEETETEEEVEDEETADTINPQGSQFNSAVPEGETSDCENKEVVTTTEGGGNGSVDNATEFNYDDVPVMDVAPADENLEFQYSDDGDTITAYKGDFPVADLKREHAGENQKVFANAAFVPSVIKYAKQNSETAALNAFGFKMRTIKVPVDNLVQARVEKELAKQTAELASSKESYNDRLTQSLQIALAGVNKNFFRGTSNPLMDELVAELAASSSLQSPRAFVNRVFASCGEEFAKVIMTKAMELCGKTDEVRNELAAALGDVNMVDDDEEQDDDSVTARLASGGKTVKAKSTTTVASSHKVTQISQINERAKELGGLFNKI